MWDLFATLPYHIVGALVTLGSPSHVQVCRALPLATLVRASTEPSPHALPLAYLNGLPHAALCADAHRGHL